MAYLGEDASVQDWANIAGSYGNASSDVRHVLTFNYSYRLPWDRLFSSGFGKRVFEGWGVQGITRLSTGSPLTITTGRDIRGDGTGSQRPNYVGGDQYAEDKTIQQWFNRGAFALPATGTFGNLGVYTVRAPGNISVDLSVIKRIRITESQELQFRPSFSAFPIIRTSERRTARSLTPRSAASPQQAETGRCSWAFATSSDRNAEPKA